MDVERGLVGIGEPCPGVLGWIRVRGGCCHEGAVRPRGLLWIGQDGGVVVPERPSRCGRDNLRLGHSILPGPGPLPPQFPQPKISETTTRKPGSSSEVRISSWWKVTRRCGVQT